MKTAVAETSLETYDEIRENLAGTLRGRIHRFLEDRARRGRPWLTRHEIAKAMQLETSTVSGRIFELREHGLVIEAEQKIRCPVTGRNAKAVRAQPPRPPRPQLELAV